ncbi:MAG: signal peptide peptidase SppA [Nitrospiraceae bacterium]|nr:signal peptide peptidase SppA [Nitrospiraceae bacterium]
MKKGCLIFLGILILLAIISLIFFLSAKNISLTEKVAVIYIEGPIIDSKNTVQEIKSHTKDNSIKAIILRVDSPGGGVAPSQEIYEEVKKAVAEKIVVVSMGSVAASGGYYISAPADKIIANPGTLTGSIGVIMEIPNIEGLMNKLGIKTEVIKSGRHKDIASVFRKMKKDDRVILQRVLDDVHEQFINAVAEGRDMDVSDVRKISDGRIFTGRQAVDAGLVDELGTFENAITVAAEMAGIEGEPDVISKKERFSFFDMLRGNFAKELSDILPFIKIKYMLAP